MGALAKLSSDLREVADPAEALLLLLSEFGAIESQDSTWFSLVEELLRIVRKLPLTAEHFEGVDAQLPGSVIAGIESETSAIVEGSPSSTFVRIESLPHLLDLANDQLNRWSEDRQTGAVLAARGIAGGIDACHWKTFVPWVRRRIVVTIEPDVAFPVFRYDPTGHIALPANTRPDHLPHRRLDEVPHVRLGPSVTLPYRLELNFDLWFRLDPLSQVKRLKVAALVPNLGLDEFDFSGGARPETFRNGGPKDPVGQIVVISELIGHAAEAGAHVIVVPEYCISEEMREPLRKAIEGMDPQPHLVVGGSSDRELADESPPAHVNEGWLLVPDQIGLSFSKVFPAVVMGLEEDTAPRSDVCVYWTSGWAIAVLICRDAMSQELLRHLGDLGVNLLLVPAFSDRTGTLARSPCDLRSVSQAFVAVAIAPAKWTFDEGETGGTDPAHDDDGGNAAIRVEAAFDGPYETPATPLVAPGIEAKRSELTRGFWLFEAHTRAVSWHHHDDYCN